ncbi:hypothetical protein T069G_10158 [Trichoderma breve]|uniref:Transcription factor domain-containing protein n=1 Tax=Trichoderma breve TaxID=2034170 RepID=A0A9W9E4A0_9HYPO|nr:hypothetical protein T069G_10158 [Trichoderma breve]KAJ4856790.1 hypothetical protein T069G_10158 [Trichoderma breve]
MRCLVDAVSKLVTSNDELTNSLEGIECIMTESIAMLTAQLLGLHTGTGGPVNITLEPKSRDRIDPDYMWFRIVLSDRALSLILGLPQGSSLDDSFASPNALESCMALERIERIQAVAAGLILRRNGAETSELLETYKIDKMLQDAAALMSPQWSFTHHNLLLQLHLPFMLQPSSADGPNHDYSKMTASAASRTIISDFVAFHNSNPLPYYCRMIDFVVFIASVTLCIAHIDARHQHHPSSDNNCVGRGSFTALDSLRHQRLRDRGLLDYILEIMEMKARVNHDIVAQKISAIIRPLLAAESDSDNGRYYLTTASRSVDQRTYSQKSQPQSLGETGETPNKLLIYIPHFGTINIEAHPEITNGGNVSILGNNASSSSAGHEILQDAAIEVDDIGPSDLDWQAILSTYSNAFLGSDDWYIAGI